MRPRRSRDSRTCTSGQPVAAAAGAAYNAPMGLGRPFARFFRSDPRPRLVLDTNVLMGAVWGSTPARVVNLWRDGAVVLCVSDPILREYEHILSKVPRSRRYLKEFQDHVEALPNTISCRPKKRLRVIKDDPSDNMFLECALEADAHYIISADKHVKKIDGYRGIQVLSSGAYLKHHGLEPPPERKPLWSGTDRLSLTRRIRVFLERLLRRKPQSSKENGGR